MMSDLFSTKLLTEHFQNTIHQPEQFVCTQGFGNPELTNSSRAQTGKSLIVAYQESKDTSEDLSETLQDMLSEILHFMHKENIEPSKVLDRSIEQFITETSF